MADDDAFCCVDGMTWHGFFLFSIHGKNHDNDDCEYSFGGEGVDNIMYYTLFFRSCTISSLFLTWWTVQEVKAEQVTQ